MSLSKKQIRQLEEAQLWQNNQAKQYYFRLSEIIREYLESRYGFLALESTTPEVLREIQNKLKDRVLYSDLKVDVWRV